MFHEEKRLQEDISIRPSATFIPYAPETMGSTALTRTLRRRAEKADLINIFTGILRQACAVQLFPLSFTAKPYRIKHLFKCSGFVLHLAFGGLKSVNRLTVCVASLRGFWKIRWELKDKTVKRKEIPSDGWDVPRTIPRVVNQPTIDVRAVSYAGKIESGI